MTGAKRYLFLRLLLLLCGLHMHIALSYGAPTQDTAIDAGTMEPSVISLTPYFSVLEDPAHSLTFTDVQTAAVAKHFTGGLPPAEDINYGHSDSTYWFRFHVRNTGDSAALRLLEISSPWLSNIAFYQPTAEGGYHAIETGSSMPFVSRPYKNRNFVFPVTILPHSDDVFYLRIHSLNVIVPAKLWTPEAFRIYERQNYLAQGWYFGIALAMVLFNLFLGIMLRDSLYFIYIGTVISTTFLIAELHGLAEEFLWPDSPLWANIALPSIALFSIAAYILFMRRMLNTDQVIPRTDMFLKWFFGIGIFYPISFTISSTFFIKIGVPLTLIAIMLIAVASIACAVRRQRSAYYFVAAFLLTGLGAVTTLLSFSGSIHTSFFTVYSIQIGSALEMLLLAFALADRFHMIRRKAIDDVQQVNAGLEGRLKTREIELNAIHQRLREAEQRALLGAERQRMTQDMHDGLGSSLVAALRAVERGHLDENTVTDMLRGCIDDLKLAIDSMEVVDADLLLLLATLRFRLAPRLESAGIKLHWEISEVPDLGWLTPGNSLHILRILQEAFTNILKHAQANSIRVATTVEAGNVLVTIANNGQGFDIAKALRGGGKGLHNQLRRAESIGGTVTWHSSESGTVLTLFLPIQTGSNVAQRHNPHTSNAASAAHTPLITAHPIAAN